ncbi:MAG: hypothetical protein V1862_09115 [Methanobacteriota archaeon]
MSHPGTSPAVTMSGVIRGYHLTFTGIPESQNPAVILNRETRAGPDRRAIIAGFR